MDIFSSSLKLSISRFLNAIITFIGLSYFAQNLGADRLGIFFLFQAVLGMASLGANLGLGGSVLKRLSEGKDREEFLGTGLLLISISTTLAAGIIYLTRHALNQYIGSNVAILLLIAVAARESFRLSFNVLRGELRIEEAAALEVIQRWMWIGIGAILVTYGYGAKGLIYSLIISYIAPLFYGLFLWDTSPTFPRIKHAKSLIQFAKFNLVAFIDGYAYNWADVLILGYILSQTAVGAYEAAWRVTSVVVIVSSSIGTAILPKISEWSSNSQYDKIEQQLPTAILGSVFFVIPSLFGAIILSEELLKYFFGGEFIIASTALIVLMVGRLVESFDRILKTILSGLDRPDLRAVAVVVSLASNITLNIILIREIEILGAAIATTSSFTVSTILTIVFLDRHISIGIPLKDILWSLVCSIIMSFIIQAVKMIVPVVSVSVLLGTITLGAAVYSSLMLLSANVREVAISLLPECIVTFIIPGNV